MYVIPSGIAKKGTLEEALGATKPTTCPANALLCMIIWGKSWSSFVLTLIVVRDNVFRVIGT
jgi:hypothetical protein